jgi:hypothetical protein
MTGDPHVMDEARGGDAHSHVVVADVPVRAATVPAGGPGRREATPSRYPLAAVTPGGLR